MTEVIARDGTWTFNGEIVRIVPGHDRGVHKLRRLLGEVTVPLAAVAGIAYEPGRKGGRLRLRLRDGADPFLQAVAGWLADGADPYRLTVDADRTGAAEFFVDEVRNAMLIEQVPDGPSERYLLPGPGVPLTAAGADGIAAFDGETVRLEWNWTTEESKKTGGPRQFAVQDLTGVEWNPGRGLDYGHLRFRPKDASTVLPPKHDPNSLLLWGFNKERGATALLAAAVVARLPHPSCGSEPRIASNTVPLSNAAPSNAKPPVAALAGPIPTEAAEPVGDDEPAAAGRKPESDHHDALLRRLRELGDLRRDGILTDEEFTTAKQALIRRF